MKLHRSIPVFFGLALLGATLRADTAEEMTPRELRDVGITEHLGAQIDLDLTFIGEDGYPHALREYFQKGRPVVLNLVYYTCPMLCNLVLNGQVDGMRQLPWTPGSEFEVVTISIDPSDHFGLARDKKAAYLASYNRPAPGWHFLVDNGGNVAKLASQVGFGYKMDPLTNQFAHAAAIFILTPEGKVSRYLYGVKFKPFDLRLAITEAAQGKFGVTDRFLLYCFHYDPASRGYVPFARNFMRFGGLLAMLVLGFVLYRLWRGERRLAVASHMVTAK